MLKTVTQDPDLGDHRAADILESVRASFVTKGFDGASMQELARSAGMSAGNFYRYFPSKRAIIEALISRDMAAVMEDFSVVNRSGDPLANLRDLVSRRVAMPAPNDDARLWAEMEAVQSRDSGLAGLCQSMQGGICDHLFTTLGRIAGRSAAFMRTHHAHTVDALMILVKGAAIRACHPSDDTDPAALHALVMRMFDTIMADVSALSPTSGG